MDAHLHKHFTGDGLPVSERSNGFMLGVCSTPTFISFVDVEGLKAFYAMCKRHMC